ncbi:MAG: hypothetical protein JJE25_02355 [Bacteroidia bacterium]|nr:hypothetical protein [Bacteroidia bacterium]
MNIFLTFDYELFFGSRHGTVERCIVQPTEELAHIADKHNIPLVFFVDCGYLIKLEEYRKKFASIEKDYKLVFSQLEKMVLAGHELQLHIHPHWEDCSYDGERWIIKTARYKLSDFSEKEAAEIILRYANILQHISSKPLVAYRAGGWCVQPFSHIKDAMQRIGIKFDSSVFANGFHNSLHYDYDFRNAPTVSSWNFEIDPVSEDPTGTFREIAISSHTLSPLFFWRLYLLGRLFPSLHKPMSDGSPIMEKGFRKKILTSFTTHCVSADGYNASLLNRALKKHRSANKGNEFVVIGHPKAFTRYSLRKLDEFISDNHTKHDFITFTSYHPVLL